MSDSIKTTINQAYSDLERLCEQSAELARTLDSAYQAALAGERQHHRYRPRPRTSHALRARFFVCKWVAEHHANPQPTWAQAATVRLDVLYSRGLAELLGTALSGWLDKHHTPVTGLDYLDMI